MFDHLSSCLLLTYEAFVVGHLSSMIKLDVQDGVTESSVIFTEKWCVCTLIR
jgi:hypothetical protein